MTRSPETVFAGTSRACALSLAAALREGMLQVAAAQRAATGQQLKSELVYGYLSSQQFANRVGGIVDAFSAMKEDLEKEKRSMSRQWAKREKELERAMTSTVCMYGDLQGIIGGALPEMKLLALPGVEAEMEAREEGAEQELAEADR